jgi:hypothetical protein
MSNRLISALFLVGAAYDGILGLVFLCAPGWVFQTFAVTPPNHPGYVQFPAALLIVFSLMFLSVARDPSGNRNLIPYGALLKVSYSGVALWHWANGGIPGMWKPWAVADIAFLILFLAAYRSLRPGTGQGGPRQK